MKSIYKKFAAGALALCLTLSLAAPSAANYVSSYPVVWPDEYTYIILDNLERRSNYYQLVDLDLDGDPELVVGELPGSGGQSRIETIYSCKDYELVEYEQEGNQAMSLLPLVDGQRFYEYYYNNAGQGKIVGAREEYNGMQNSVWEAGPVKLTDGQFSLTADLEAVQTDGVMSYYVRGQSVSRASFEYARAHYLDGWTRVEGFGFLQLYGYQGRVGVSDVLSFMNNYSSTKPLAGAPSSHKLSIDGVTVNVGAYNLNGSNYFKLRDLAMLLNGSASQFSVAWDASTGRISLRSGEAYTPVGGECTALPSGAKVGTATQGDLYTNGLLGRADSYNIDGNNYYPIRILAIYLNFDVDWDAATSTIKITTGRAYSE